MITATCQITCATDADIEAQTESDQIPRLLTREELQRRHDDPECVPFTAADVIPGAASQNRVAELVEVMLPTRLQYPFMGYAGALSVPWLERRVAAALGRADDVVRVLSGGRGRILVWDALRTRECQHDIWDRYAVQLRAEHPALEEGKIQELVAKFVSNPCGVFRHGTGGAVDVTLFWDGKEAYMGTAFDEFSARAAADFFREHVPMTEKDRRASSARELLREAMESAGFVVLPEEWWHYELGTKMWGEMVGERPFLDQVMEPPGSSHYPAEIRLTPKSMPSMTTGVAQAFASNKQRQAALIGLTQAHYYARTSTQSRTELEAMFTIA